jgi:hypothetical protein
MDRAGDGTGGVDDADATAVVDNRSSSSSSAVATSILSSSVCSADTTSFSIGVVVFVSISASSPLSPSEDCGGAVKKYASSLGDDESADSVCGVDGVRAMCAGPRSGPTEKADVDDVKNAQTAASRSVLPLALLLPLFPLLRQGNGDGVGEGILIVVLASLVL